MNDTTPLPLIASRNTPKPTLAQKIETTKAAWMLLAPDVRFSKLTCAGFDAATTASRTAREDLADINLSMRAAVSKRNHADVATRPLMKRVVAAVQADPSFGPDSSLYRAMGYIPESERKNPSKAEPGAFAGRRRQVLQMERLAVINAAWSDVAPEAEFGEMSRAQFIAATAPAWATRAALLNITTSRKRAIGDRNTADTVSKRYLKRVVAAIKASPSFGPDSALYRALGYIPESERKTRSATLPLEALPTASPV